MQQNRVPFRVCRIAPIFLIAACLIFPAQFPSWSAQNQPSKTIENAGEQSGDWSVTLGVETQSLWWRPAFRSEFFRYFMPVTTGKYVNRILDIPVCLSAGPSFTVTMPRGFSLQANFLWSDRYHAQSRYNVGYPTAYIHAAQSTLITRWEMDTALRYDLISMLGIFAGIRHTGCDVYMNTRIVIPGSSGTGLVKGSDTYRDVGPRIGVYAELHLAGPLSVQAHIAGMYLYAWFDRGTAALVDNTGAIAVSSIVNYTYHGLGTELAASLVLRDDPHLTVALGFRYQCVAYLRGTEDRLSLIRLGASGFTDVVRKSLNKVDQVYGFTLSASHTFNL
jgi:hypothetical protein